MRLSKGKKFKLQICLMIIAMVLQSIIPVFSNNTFAEGYESKINNVETAPVDAKMGVKAEENEVEPIGDEVKPSQGEAESKEEKTEINENEVNKKEEVKKEEINKVKEENKPVDDENVEAQQPTQDQPEEMEEEEAELETYATPKDLGNIFTLKSLKVNGIEANENQLVTIADGTTVNLDYTWGTIGKDVKSGDYAEIDIPDTFKLGATFENKDIVLSGGEIVGKYSIINNKLRFVFNDKIEEVGEVTNGTVGFGVKFNEEKFKTDVVEEIEFNDKGDKTITIIGKPKVNVKSIAKKGIPDSSKDAKKITWTIDVTNPSGNEMKNAKVKDLIPEGLEIDPSSVKVYNLTVGLDGKLNQGNIFGVTSNISGNNFEVNLGSIATYKGYRVEYTTIIKDLTKTTFTNNAALVADGVNLPAEATVSGITRSNLIEKDGRKKGENIEWNIDVNKAGGSIEEAIVTDSLPEGTVLVPGSIKILKLTKSGTNWTESPSNKTANSFPVNLGKVESGDAYRIKFETSIDYSKINNGDYKKIHDFKNETILKDGNKELGEAEKTVKITRDDLLRKEGNATVNYEKKELKWKIHVNEAKHSIKNAIVTDILPKGLSIIKEDIKIYDSENKLVVIGNDKITITSNGENTKIVIDLGNIDKNYRIEYTTKITDFTVNTFSNSASLGGVGVGTGGAQIVKPVNPPGNTYGKSFSGIDYNTKTMDWTITANPTREAMSELKITDTFPNKGLILLPDTLEVKVGGVKKDIGTHYKLTDIDENYKNGFIVEFIGDTLPINAAVSITYKTSYDPEKGIDKNASADGNYINKAKFDGKTINNNLISQERTANHKVKTESWNSGKKLGKLISIDETGATVDSWTSGNERKIKWEVYTNYLEQNLGNNVTISDVLGYDGEVDITGIEVRKYTVNKAGDTTLGEAIDKSSYNVTPAENNKGFTLSFKSEVKERYVVVFTTSVPNISQKVYTNTATTNTESGLYPYTGSIGFDKADNNLTKKSLDTTGGKVYTDDEVNWNIKINEGLSTVQKDVKIVDTISQGMVYKNDSLKIYKLSGTQRIPVASDQYSLNVSKNEAGETVLTILFNNKISSTYEIDYTTIVTATTGTVNNKVDYSGANLEKKSVETAKLKAEQFSYVGGDPSKGKIKIIKTDSDGKKITSSNAKFVLWYKLNGVDQKFGDKEFETKNGELEIGNLPLNRTYYLEEVSSPEGYIASKDRVEIEITKAAGQDGKGTYEQSVKNEKIKRSIQFIKKGEDLDKDALEGVEFTLYKESDKDFKTPIKKATSGKDGLVKFEDVEFGKYIIKETTAKNGYLPYASTIAVEVNAKGEVTKIADVVNKRIRGNIEIEKVDESNKPLQGANFGLYQKSDKDFKEPIQAVKSDKDGKVIFTNVPYGDYKIQEIEAPDSYAPSKEVINVSIEQNGVTVKPGKGPIVNKKIIGDVEVIKFGESEDVTLKGAEFVLEKNGIAEYKGKTDAQGRYVFKDVVYGTYILKETKAPDGYNLTSKTQEVKISEFNQEVITVKFENTKIRGSIKLKKLDENEKALKDAEFSIYDLEDKEFKNPLATVISNEDGEVIFEGVEYGKYNIKETKAPEGYVLSDKVQRAEIKIQGQIIELDNITNKTIRGDIEFTKKDNEGNSLADVEFTIYKKSDVEFKNPVKVIMSSRKGLLKSEGVVKFDGIDYGEYVIKETKTPVGYIASNKLIEVIITEDGKLIELSEVINTKIRGNVELIKKDNENKLVSGAKFGIYEKSDKNFKNPVQERISDKNGVVRFEKILYGDYIVKEIEAPEGYIASEQKIEVKIEEHQKTINLVDVINTRVRASVELIKKDNEGNKLSGATFGIYSKEDKDFKKPVQTQISDGNGLVRFDDIPVGEYLVKEISAPAGYIMSDKVASVKVTQEDHKQLIKLLEVINTRVRASVELIKKDNEGNKLSGATFGIYSKEDKDFKKPVQTQISDGNGLVRFDDIPVGEYLVKEISAPAGYIMSDKVASVKVTQEDHKQVIKLLEVINTRVRASVELIKKDNEGKLLTGVEFTIYNKLDKDFKNPIQEQTSDGNGLVRFNDIPVGEYVIKETKGLEGYVKLNKLLEVKVTQVDHSNVIKLDDVINKKIIGSIEIFKRDKSNHKPLKGAEIAVYTEDDVLIGKKITEENGKEIFESLEYGKYYYKEIKAPVGYVLDSSKHTFVIEKDGVKLEENLDNTKKPVIPVKPGKPEKPSKPSKPSKPGAIEKPGVIVKPGKPGDTNGQLPQTGQNSNVGIYLAAALLLIVGFALRKKTKSNN